MSLSGWDHLADLSEAGKARLIGGMDGGIIDVLPFDWWLHARPEQLAPTGDWRIWLVMAGRGFGKTRAGAEWVRAIAEADGKARIALVAASLHEARSVMVEGESGLLAIAPAWNRPIWNPALRRLVWRSGAQAMLFGAAEPESLRGPQFSHGWADELAKWPHAKMAWDNLMMGMRLGARPQLVATTTPRPTPLMRQLASDPQVRVSRGRTYDNATCLPEAFLEAMERDYGKSRLGRQELEGELIAELEGALWSHALLDACRCPPVPLDALEHRVERVVVAVDPPAGTQGDACGIIVAGLAAGGAERAGVERVGPERVGGGGSGIGGGGGEGGPRALVLADASVERASPERWARAVAQAAATYGADRVVAEANNGGAMVESVLRAASLHLPVRLVHASRGKVARAEPVAALYEAGRVGHAGSFAELEEEMCGLTVGGGYVGPGRSPDRADALVWALSDYGNRIPALTLEVFADDGPVLVETIAEDASGGAIAATGLAGGASVGGYAATGRNAGEALSPLFDCFGLSPVVRGEGICLIGDLGGVGAGAQIGERQLARAANGKKVQAPRHVRDQADSAPVRLSLRYYDPLRDYQAGMQAAARPGAGRREEVLDLPATLDASAARQQAELRVRRLWSGRSRIEAQCSWRLLAHGPGDVVALDGQEGLWRIEHSHWEDGLVKLELRLVGAALAASPAASSGAVVRQQDLVHGPSRIALIELLSAGDTAADAPLAMVAAAGTSAGWRSAGLYIRNLGDGTLDYVGATAPPAIMGRVVTLPSPGASPHLCDLRSALVVELLHGGMTLMGASELQLAQGVNLCWVGGELIQFGAVSPLGGNSYRLERLWRGRRGTEAMIGQHMANEAFVLIEQARLFQLPASRVHIGDRLGVSAIGIGDLVPVEAELLLSGAAMLPMAPVHLRASEEAGGLRLSWARRSRTGWRWNDGADAPLCEEQERYELAWSDAVGAFRRVELGTPAYLYESSQQAVDLAAGYGGAVNLTVRQIGTHGIGPAVSLALNI